MNGIEYDESYDDSDYEAVFEDLEYDEARRRRRRRGRGRGRRGGSRVPLPSPTPPPRQESIQNRLRDRQLARAINNTAEEISDADTRLAKLNSDVGRLRQLAMVSLIMPRAAQTQRIHVVARGAAAGGGFALETTNNAVGPGVIEVATGAQRLDMMPLIVFMMMSRGIGSSGARGSSNDMMMPILLLMMTQQQQQQQQQAQAGAAAGAAQAGAVDPTMMLVLMMAMGGL